MLYLLATTPAMTFASEYSLSEYPDCHQLAPQGVEPSAFVRILSVVIAVPRRPHDTARRAPPPAALDRAVSAFARPVSFSRRLQPDCLQRFKTEPLYRRKSEPPWVGSFLSPFLRL